MDAVGDLLAQRRVDRFPVGPAIALAALLHAGVLVGLLASTFAHPIHAAAPRFVAVRLLQAGAIRPPAPVAAAPEPAPPATAPKPRIEKPVEEAPKPSKNAVLLPAKEDKKKPTPPPVSRPGKASTPAVSLPSTGEESAAHVEARRPAPGAPPGSAASSSTRPTSSTRFTSSGWS